MRRVLFVALGPPEIMSGSRVRVAEFTAKARELEPLKGVELRVIFRPSMQVVTLCAALQHGIRLARYYVALWAALAFVKWDLIQLTQVFWAPWCVRILNKIGCVVPDVTDLGVMQAVIDGGQSAMDGVWLSLIKATQQSRVRRMLRMCRECPIVVANAGVVSPPFMESVRSRIRTLVDPVDTDLYRPREGSAAVVMGWTGSNSTAYFVRDIEPVLLKIMREQEGKISLVLYGAKASSFSEELRKVARIVEWNREQDSDVITGINIGIVPAPGGVVAAAKQPYKILQHMASGAAIVATPIGMVPYLVRPGETGLFATTAEEWYSALTRLIEDSGLREELRRNSRREAEVRFSYERYAKEWQGVMQEALMLRKGGVR